MGLGVRVGVDVRVEVGVAFGSGVDVGSRVGVQVGTTSYVRVDVGTFLTSDGTLLGYPQIRKRISIVPSKQFLQEISNDI